MANNKIYLANLRLENGKVKFGTKDVKLYLGDNFVYPFNCEASTSYTVSNVSYPSEIDADVTAFTLSFDYQKVEVDTACTETVTETGSENVSIECGENTSTAQSRTVEGVYDYHGTSIPYSLTQTRLMLQLIFKYNITDISNPTKITNNNTSINKVYIDGVKQDNLESWYLFDTIGEHELKYSLKGTEIGGGAFRDCTNISRIVELPEGITSIDTYSFRDCSGITGNLVIPNSVTSIGEAVFRGCTNLTGDLIIPNNVETIGKEAFNGCSGFTGILSLPNSLTTIGDGAFSSCSGLTGDLIIPSGITEINQGAFRYCSSLNGNLTLPSNLVSIGYRAFYNCKNLTGSLNIPESVTSIDKDAFYYTRNLSSITCNPVIPPTLIDSSAFNNTGNCPIYVPSESVAAYKEAENWSVYESRIQAASTT